MSLTGAGLVLLAAALPWVLGRPRSRAAGHREGHRRGRAPAVEPAVLLDLLDIALAAGASIPGALTAMADAVAPAAPADQLRTAGAALRLGAGWEEAWRGSGPSVQPVADVLRPAWVDGVDPTTVVRHRAAAIRARRRREGREAAARLGARLVLPLGLCFLPAFVLLSMVPVLLSGAGVLFAG